MTKYILILLLDTLLWGSTFAFTKELIESFTPTWLLVIRFTATSILLLLLFYKEIYNSTKNLLKIKNRRLLFKVLVLGVINFFAIYFQTIGLKDIAASNSGFITAFSVVLVPIFEFFLWKIPVTRNVKTAVLVSLFGLYLLSYGLSLPQHFVIGDLYTLVCAVFYGFYIILVGNIVKYLKSGSMIFFVFSITAILSFALAFFAENKQLTDTISNLTTDTTIVIQFELWFLIIFGSIIPYYLMGIGQKHVDAQTAALVYVTEPLFAMFIAIIFFGEKPVTIRFIGGAFVLLSLVIATYKKSTY